MEQLAPHRLARSALDSTLSGTTTAALPLIASSVLTCWTKLSCLFEVALEGRDIHLQDLLVAVAALSQLLGERSDKASKILSDLA